MMIDVFVDVEADGPCPGLYSMVSIGMVVVVNGKMTGETYYGEFAPISDDHVPAALAVSGISREEHLKYPDAEKTTKEMLQWCLDLQSKYRKDNQSTVRLSFMSDNNGFDWQFPNYYFWKYCNCNPFGHSSTNISSMYKGLVRDRRANHKHLRITKHTHHPVDDSKGNAEAFEQMVTKFNLNSGKPRHGNNNSTNQARSIDRQKKR